MSPDEISVFPCQWPTGYPKTEPQDRTDSRFKQSPDIAQRFLKNELYRLKASNIVVSSNTPVKKDGSMYADAMHRKVAQDPSVAVYFTYRNNQTVLCCDRYRTIWENVYAIAKTVEAIRAIDRWGVSDFIKRSFTGFQELPPSTVKKEDTKPWWEILMWKHMPNVNEQAYDATKINYRILSKRFHPDGTEPDNKKMQELNNAWEQAQKYFGK